MRVEVLLALMIAPAVVCAAELTMAEAVARALASGEVDARRFGVDEARAEARALTVRPNPTLAYDRQDIFDEGIAPGFAQDLVKVEQSLPGQRLRRARRQLGASQVDRAAAEVAVTRRKREQEVRRAFVRALVAQEETTAYDRVIERVRSLGGVISARVSAGESSNYEQARIRLAEAQELDAQDTAAVESARRRAELAAAVGIALPEDTRLVGTLTLHAPEARTIDHRVSSALAALDMLERGQGALPADGTLRAEVLELKARAAVASASASVTRAESRPQLTVGAGYMHFDQTGIPAQSGYNAIAAVVLPLPARRDAELAAARARGDAAHAELLATVRRIRGEITGAREALRAATRRFERLQRTQKAQLDPLLEMSRTSYQAGLQSLLELLDAYRLEREFSLQSLRARGAITEALEDLALAIGIDAAEWQTPGAAAIGPAPRRPEGE